MKIPDQIKTYCPKCKKSTPHKVKQYKKGRVRKEAKGQRRHDIKGKGYTSKIAGKVIVYKRSKRTTVMLACNECGYKIPRILGRRTKKALEIKKKG